MATVSSARPGFFAAFGGMCYTMIVAWGDLAQFTGRILRWMLTRWPSPGTLTVNFYQIGVRSVPVVGITGLFIGMVLAVQSYGEIMRLPAMRGLMGVAINTSVISELGPVLAATMLAGRVGSAIAADASIPARARLNILLLPCFDRMVTPPQPHPRARR